MAAPKIVIWEIGNHAAKVVPLPHKKFKHQIDLNISQREQARNALADAIWQLFIPEPGKYLVAVVYSDQSVHAELFEVAPSKGLRVL